VTFYSNNEIDRNAAVLVLSVLDVAIYCRANWYAGKASLSGHATIGGMRRRPRASAATAGNYPDMLRAIRREL
jgi:hypothetical protein